MTLPKQVLIRLGSVLFFKWQYWKTLFKYYLFMLFSNNNIINLYLFFLSVHKNIIHNIVGNLLVYSSQLKNSLEMFYDLRFIFSATASAAEKSMQRRRYNEWKKLQEVFFPVSELNFSSKHEPTDSEDSEAASTSNPVTTSRKLI